MQIKLLSPPPGSTPHRAIPFAHIQPVYGPGETCPQYVLFEDGQVGEMVYNPMWELGRRFPVHIPDWQAIRRNMQDAEAAYWWIVGVTTRSQYTTTPAYAD